MMYEILFNDKVFGLNKNLLFLIWGNIYVFIELFGNIINIDMFLFVDI